MQPLIECQKSEVRSQATEGGETLRQPSPTRRGSPQPQGDRIITRSRNTSPNEELQLRLARVAPLIKISDHEVAALLHETRLELVEPDGAIRFELAGLKREYYHPESPTCQNLRGQKVLVTISRTFTDAIFVIQPDHKYLDTIPLKNTLPWFDHTRLGAEIREKETVLKRSAKELEQLHGGEIERQAYAGRGNVAKVAGWRQAKIFHTFSQPSSASADSSAPAPRASDDAAPERRYSEEVTGASLSVAAHDRGVSSNSASSAHAVPGDPARPVSAARQPAVPPFVGGARATVELTNHETKRANLFGKIPRQARDDNFKQTRRALTNDSLESDTFAASPADASSLRAGDAGPLNSPAPRHNLAEQLTTERTRCQARVHRAAAGRQRARVDYADALDDLAVSITTFNQPTEGE